MNATLNYARIGVSQALLDFSGNSKGQLTAFLEHPPADQKTFERQLIHKIELEGGRFVKAETSPVYVLETHSRRRPLPPMNDFEFSFCNWRRAINALSPHQIAWLQYCYGKDLTYAHQVAICEAVWAIYQKKLPEGLLRKTKKRLIKLVWLAVQDVAAKNRNDKYREIAGTVLAGLVNVCRSTWCEVYSKHWQGMKDTVRALDVKALEDVISRMRDDDLA